MFKKTSEYFSDISKDNIKLQEEMIIKFMTPLTDILNGNINEAEFSRKKIVEALKNCDNINKRVEKAQKGEKSKLMELVQEQGECKMKKETIEQQTTLTFKDVNIRNELQLIELIETLQNLHFEHYQGLSTKTESYIENTEKFSAYGYKKRDLYESGQSVDKLSLDNIDTKDFQHKISTLILFF